MCRSRKSRCDGTKPKCKLCTELGAECVYREPGIKLDAGDKLILERLNRIESLLQMAWAPHANGLAGLGHGSPSMSNATALSGGGGTGTGGGGGGHGSGHDGAAAFVAGIPAGGIGTWTSATNISTMPKIHTNAALHLLQWPLIRDLVSRPYDPQILLQLEMAREPLHSLTKTPCVDLSNTSAYIEAYFERGQRVVRLRQPLHLAQPLPHRPVQRLPRGPRELHRAAGAVARPGQPARQHLAHRAQRGPRPACSTSPPAWALLPGMMTSNSVLAAQCHLLAAAYLFYLVRPLEAWNLLCTTSTKLQLLLMSPNRVPPDQRELTERIYWNALLFESDLLAELDLPHSGVVLFEENVGLPGGFEGDEREAVGRDDLCTSSPRSPCAACSTASASSSTPRTPWPPPPASSPVVAELDFQLTQWYESLPMPLQFPFSRALLPDPVQTVLRLRFFACRTIIYRPYILAVLDNEQAC